MYLHGSRIRSGSSGVIEVIMCVRDPRPHVDHQNIGMGRSDRYSVLSAKGTLMGYVTDVRYRNAEAVYFRSVPSNRFRMQKPDISMLTLDQLRASAMVQQTFTYWFTDHGHVRSPFPAHMHDKLREQVLAAFSAWVLQLDAKALDEMNEEVAFGKFEEVLFHEGVRLARTEDEVLTLRFPFLPRLGDRIEGGGTVEGRAGENIVRKRNLVREEKDEFLRVEVENVASGAAWETRFELP